MQNPVLEQLRKALNDQHDNEYKIIVRIAELREKIKVLRDKVQQDEIVNSTISVDEYTKILRDLNTLAIDLGLPGFDTDRLYNDKQTKV